MTTSGPTSSSGPRDSTSESVRALTDDVRSLVQQELRNAQRQLTDKARQAGRAGVMLGGAAVLGALAVGASASVVMRALDRVLPPTMSAVFATAIYGAAAAALGAAGTEELRRSLPLVPEQTVEGMQADVKAATRAAPSRAPRG